MWQFRTRKMLVVISSVTVLFFIYMLSSAETRNYTKYNKIISEIEKSDRTDLMPPNSHSTDLRKTSSGQLSKYKMSASHNNKISVSRKKFVPVFDGGKLVHLDLKGAPPKISYYDEFFPLIRKLGATGVLIEYEDMFPYTSVDIAASNCYSKDDIKYLLNRARENNLEVIPLIQTFGHMEFVLKLEEYANLREVPSYPQVICPSRNGTMPLLKSMIDEVLALHPGIQYIHIGCDEVYNLAECNLCLDVLEKNSWSKQELFLSHVRRVSRYIKETYPNVKPLVWDDEFRKMSLPELTSANLGQLVEPVVWKYTPDVNSYMHEQMWDIYSSVFGSVWIASAFKGATGPDKFITDIEYHLENHRSWMRLVSAYKDRLKFKGIMLTGWQRYDHFAILCELLPVGLPSLAVNLGYLMQSDIELTTVPRVAEKTLKCGPGLLHPKMGARCTFPGSLLYDKVHQLSNLMDQIAEMEASSEAKGWLNIYNIHTGFSSPAHVEDATSNVGRFKMELIYIEQELRKEMAEVFQADTVKEWIYTVMTPVRKRLQALWDAQERLLAHKVWPRRPLQIHDEEL